MMRVDSRCLRFGVVLLLISAWLGCGISPRPVSTLASLSDAELLTASKLRTFCASCHGLGPLRFIYSGSDAELWNYITHTNAPHSTKVWADVIFDAINWPHDSPPAVGDLRDPAQNRDWMPKGFKRVQFSEDITDDQSTRRLMLQTIRDRTR